jgi:hypothetical protein
MAGVSDKVAAGTEVPGVVLVGRRLQLSGEMTAVGAGFRRSRKLSALSWTSWS